MEGMLNKLGLQEDEAIVHPWINKAVEKAQGKVEARNFDQRKNILKYDDVMNDQRKVVFEQRRDFMREDTVRPTIDDMRHSVVDDVVTRRIPPEAYPEQWDAAGLKEDVLTFLNLDLPVEDWAKEEGIADAELRERILKAANDDYAARIERNTEQVMVYVEKQVLLQTLDHLWREHLVTLDHLRQVVGWRGYAQRDPLNEYKQEAFELFDGLIGKLREQVTGNLMRIEVRFDAPDESAPETGGFGGQMAAPALSGMASDQIVSAEARDPNDQSTWGRVGRNEPCPCGSGKKFKHCHGQFA
ncbi:MAG: SEC-C metal-binding domain-containing protein, partial [Bosea sp. (in: a-proteobacteria)]